MRTPTLLIIVLGGGLALALASLSFAAQDQSNEKQTQKTVVQNQDIVKPIQIEEMAKVEMVGSLIEVTFWRVGRITNGSVPVVVIDRSQILRSGAQTTAGVLQSDPAIRVRSGR